MEKPNVKLEDFIKKNIPETIRKPQENIKIFHRPYTVPCAGKGFRNFFYWDTYFSNWGLLGLKMYDQAKNNLLNMADFIDYYGYIPNADVLTDRSQPPFFVRAVKDYTLRSGDNEIIKTLLPRMLKEHEFWMSERMTDCGLNCYGGNAEGEQLKNFNIGIAQRLNLSEESLDINRDVNLMACAESGWDFSSRFFENGKKCFAAEVCPVDLNSILYDAEIQIANFAEQLKEFALYEEFSKIAAERKKKMTELMFDSKTGLYFDYRYTKKQKNTSLFHAASFFPVAYGISDSKEGMKTLLSVLEKEHGIVTCEESDSSEMFQWDYPFMWAPLAAIAADALLAADMKNDAQRIMQKYCETVELNYYETGNLWEKYNAVTGKVGVSAEYETPPMIGWTAGAYLKFVEIMNNFK